MGASIFIGLVTVIMTALVLGTAEDFFTALVKTFKDLLHSSSSKG